MNLTAAQSADPLLSLQDLRTYFHTRSGIVRAVDGVSFSINKGETLGIVGESGSGKSVACYSLLRLLPQPPARFESGRALFDSLDLLHCSDDELRHIRGDRVAMIFQDPMTSLNPYMRIGDQVIEPLLIHRKISRKDAFARGVIALREVGIQDAENRMRSYPHEFSGGMRQRVMIAMALITKPELLIADEPTTALDVTLQAQILELIRAMQRALGSAVIFITHDIGIVSGFCDRVLVMYAGRVLESAATASLFYEPKHPYNQALQRAIPALNEKGRELSTIPGAPPDVSKPIVGCPFAPRCEYALEKCVTSQILLQEVAPAHHSACLRVQLGEIDLTPPASGVTLSANKVGDSSLHEPNGHPAL
ncbi:MAG TPA: ABC transporter ATP-binding protein [Chthoniobacterales bacterium]|nr:ABC transporter ATP-binding protein [Chthoniobacterales bacterium]